jgi:hypothetical protein
MTKLAKLKGKPDIVEPTEPLAVNHWNLRAGVAPEAADDETATRGDILVKHITGKNDDKAVILDLAITNPTAATVLISACAAPGFAAQEYAQRKLKQYEAKFVIPKDAFVPFIQETGGRLHPTARTFLGDFIRTLLDKSPEDPFSTWTLEDKDFYLSGLRTLMEAVCTATARGVAIALLHKGGVMPVPGPPQAAPAGSPGGAAGAGSP